MRVLLWLGILSVCSARGSCDEDASTCTDKKEEPAIFDVFSKWVDDRSSEGRQFLEQLLGPDNSNSKEEGGSDAKSFFDEIKDAFAGDNQEMGEDTLEDKIRRGISSMKDAVDGSITQFITELNAGKDSRTDDDSFDFGNFVETFFSDINKKKSSDESRRMAADFIQQALELSRNLQGDSNRGFLELHDVMMQALGQVKDALVRNFGHIDWGRLKPFSIIYFLEYMESLLTPSSKRRAHIFAQEVTEKDVKELHVALHLANLAYLDTVDEIKAGLQEESSDWELIYAQLNNAPGEPAHYIALRKDHTSSTGTFGPDYLDVLLVVRGTKDFSDVLSDGLLDAVEFRGGFGHAGLVRSGKFLAESHLDLLHSLLKMAKRSKVKLTLIGHSLGAGAAAIAAMILNEDEKDIDANAIGFGCPSLLSKELSESARSYVRTIVADSDMIPRLSGPTLTNGVLDVMSYDWIEKGLADLRDGLEFLRTFLEENIKPEMDEMAKIPREEVILMPPGKCTHFYRDGNGITGQNIGCDFFDSLEISRTMVDDHLIGIGYNRSCSIGCGTDVKTISLHLSNT